MAEREVPGWFVERLLNALEGQPVAQRAVLDVVHEAQRRVEQEAVVEDLEPPSGGQTESLTPPA